MGCTVEDEWVETVEVVRPTRCQKYLFWLVLAFLSTFFAEVLSGSFPYPFVNPLGYILVVPLYGLHILVLAFIVFKVGRPRFSTLFVAGCIFGMYEAYVTKVLWNPPWEIVGEPTVRLGGVAVMELGVIAFFWHPFMAFIVPLAVATALTSSRGLLEAMPARLQGWLRHKELNVMFALAVWGGLVMGSQVLPTTAILANISNLVVLGIVLHYFMKETKGRFTMEELLPDWKEVKNLFAALLAYYALSTALLRPEALPGLGPQVAIALIYVLLFLLLWSTIEVGRRPSIPRAWRPHLDRSRALRLYGTYMATAVVTSFVALFIGPVFLLLSWFVWAAIAIISMSFSVKDALGLVEEEPTGTPLGIQARD
jgi:hypothetical protein